MIGLGYSRGVVMNYRGLYITIHIYIHKLYGNGRKTMGYGFETPKLLLAKNRALLFLWSQNKKCIFFKNYAISVFVKTKKPLLGFESLRFYGSV